MRLAGTVAVLAVLVLGLSCVRAGAGEPSKARELVAKGARLLDVRTVEEFGAGHLEGALNIPVQDLEGRLKELEPKDKPIVVYCRSGRRSAQAKSMLEKAGYGQVFDLGPMSAW